MDRDCTYGIALALILPAGLLSGQETPTLVPGTRVRVSVPKAGCPDLESRRCYQRVVGTLTSVDSLNIMVRSAEDSAEVTLPRVPGTRLDISMGPGPCIDRRGECVALGLFGGVAAGLLVGIAAGGGNGASCDCPAGVVFLLTIPAGAVVGLVIGADLPAEHWKSTYIPVRLSVGPVGRNRLGLGLSLQF